jgi:hypothetical protein
MIAHRIETVLTEDGTLALKNLPIRAGARVEVIVLVADTPVVAETDADRFPLRGSEPYRFDDPFSPAVPENDWNVLK